LTDEITGRTPPKATADASDTGRTEAFSDAVFAITITLLVLNLEVPEHAPGKLLHTLLSQWPSYVAFTVSFLYVGIVWLNHHALFRRIRHTSLGLNWANLGVLFGTALLPFPTAVLASAFAQHGDVHDQHVAVAFYAIVAAFMSATWLVVFLYLDAHVGLLEPDVPATWMRTQIRRPVTGIVLYLLTALIGWLVAPAIGLIIIVVMIFYHALTSEGVRKNPLGRMTRHPH
jgi:uncharacterized membrane protein